MGYSIHVVVTSESLDSDGLIGATVAWIDALNETLSPDAETLRLRPGEGGLVGSLKPGRDADIDAIVDACEVLRTQDLFVDVRDDFGTALLEPQPRATPAIDSQVVDEPEPPCITWSVQPPMDIGPRGLRRNRRRDPPILTPHVAKLSVMEDAYSIGFGGREPGLLAAVVRGVAYDADGAELARFESQHYTEHLIDPASDGTVGVSNFIGAPEIQGAKRIDFRVHFGVAVAIPGTVTASRKGASWTIEVEREPDEAVWMTAVSAIFEDDDGQEVARVLFPGREHRPWRGSWSAKRHVPRARRVRTVLLGAVLQGEPQHITWRAASS